MFFYPIVFLIDFVELSCSMYKDVFLNGSIAEKLNDFYSLSKRLSLAVEAIIMTTLLLSTIVWLTSTPGAIISTVPEAFAQTDDNNNNLTCWGHAATIVGTPGSDNIVGTSGRDVIVTLEGGDRVRAQGGDDFICGGLGNDRLFGEDGNDHINGGDGDDTVSGNDGDDKIFGDSGYDLLSGNDGDDNIWGGDDNDDLYGDGAIYDNGKDNLWGGDDNDYLYGGPNTDNGNAGSGADLCNEVETVRNCEDGY